MPQPWSASGRVLIEPQWQPSAKIEKVYALESTRVGQRYKPGDVSKRPFRPYIRLTQHVTGVSRTAVPPARLRPPVVNVSWLPYTGSAGWDNIGLKPIWWADGVNKSYAKMIERLKGETPELLTLAGETRETFTMIASRLTWLRESYKALRRGDFRSFIRKMGVPPLRKHRRWMNKKEYYRSGRRAADIARNASGLWLEYWFGWAPTVSDIGNALEVLCSPIPDSYKAWGGYLSRLPPRSVYNGSAGSFAQVTQSGELGMLQMVKYRVSNQNLLLLNRLGLINLPASAWEWLPFSFVVDWFFKLGNVIESFTDFVGIDVLESQFTANVKFTSSWLTGDRIGNYTYLQKGVYMRRDAGAGTSAIKKPVVLNPFRLNAVWGPLNRARTAASLITQLFVADRIQGK